MTDSANKWKLSEQEHEAVYARIASHYLPRSIPSERPVAIITGGQPGSGKSGLAAMAKHDLRSQGGYVLVDADKLRPFHKDYFDLLRKDDKTAANLTHPDAGKWAGRLMVDAVDGRRNLIIDQTSKDPEAFQKLSKQLRDQGYKIEFRAMAVSDQISQHRIRARYEEQKFVMGFGRFSTKDNHDAAYRGVAETVGRVEKDKLVDAVKLYNLNHELVYQNTLTQGHWSKETTGRLVLEGERSRELTSTEKVQIVSELKHVQYLIVRSDRHATNEEVVEISKRLSSFEIGGNVEFRPPGQSKTDPNHTLGSVIKDAGLMERRPNDLSSNVVGSVIATTSSHAAVQIGRNVGVIVKLEENQPRPAIGEKFEIGKALGKTPSKDIER